MIWDNQLPWGTVYAKDVDTVLPRFKAAGADAISLSVAASFGPSLKETVRHIGDVRAAIQARPDRLCLASTVDDIENAKVEGKLALFFNFQDTLPFENSLSMIEVYYHLGVRQAGLAYNLKNLVGDGGAEEGNSGLSRFGREVIKEMNRVGMMVDGSHAGHRTTMEAMELATAPFVFSHSNPFALRPHYRSIKDDQIKACVATGGMIGINGVGFWLDDFDATTESIFRSVDYVAELVGAENVGLGFDYIENVDRLFDSVSSMSLTWPPYEGQGIVRHKFAQPEQITPLVQCMIDHGYSDEAIAGILGGNWMRVARAVWK